MKPSKYLSSKIDYPTVHECLYLCSLHHGAIFITSAVCKQGVTVMQICNCVIILTVVDAEDQKSAHDGGIMYHLVSCVCS